MPPSLGDAVETNVAKLSMAFAQINLSPYILDSGMAGLKSLQARFPEEYQIKLPFDSE